MGTESKWASKSQDGKQTSTFPPGAVARVAPPIACTLSRVIE